MLDVTPLFRLLAARRRRRLAALDPVESQRRTLVRLVRRAFGTRFARDHGFNRVAGVADFRRAVPLRRYETMWADYWQPAFPRLVDATWPGLVPFFAVSSGTTAGRTKYIPVTGEMRRSNVRAAFDVVAHHLGHRPGSRLFAGRSLMLGGSTALVEEAPGVFSGDLSGIAARTLPRWARGFTFPPPELALVADWEVKLERIARESLALPIRALSGTPSWLLILLERVAALRGGGPPYPDLDLLIHGGVRFDGYRRRFERLLAGTPAEMREVYPASEGFVAGADRGPGEGLRLNVDHGIFFEFVPLAELDAPAPTRHWVADIETGVEYAVVLTTCAGLWAYVLGDTVRFVDRRPPRLLVTGRTGWAMSAFGEHLIGEEVERAAAAAAQAIDADVTDFAMTAVFPHDGVAIGHHRWVVEFAAPPGADAVARFAERLDTALAALNDDYRAHRAAGMGMAAPRVDAVPAGFFAAWMKARGRLGGQNKVPRIINDAALAADLVRMVEERRGR
ncbi:MAG: GH3 auxin-responsive promoter family protein [Alphaproteobacteria bacterium]|nr:GH3 auxin-responsive promoter family protein [Alphaproteobacteria bacterium]